MNLLPRPAPDDRDGFRKGDLAAAVQPDRAAVRGAKASTLPFVMAVMTGIPDRQAGDLDELLTEALRLSRRGDSDDDVRRAVLRLNSNLPEPLPTYSPSGLVECLNCLLARRAGGSA
jgi:hypothetical protein